MYKLKSLAEIIIHCIITDFWCLSSVNVNLSILAIFGICLIESVSSLQSYYRPVW